jgi:hypothetical protein
VNHRPHAADSFARVKLLILDDWRLASLAGQQRRDLLEIMKDRDPAPLNAPALK